MIGNQILAKALADQKIEFCFGIVGVPVIELGSELQTYGIKYYGYRNQQGASYSAGAVGYLTKRPGICLCVSGPGMIHGMAGVANAWSNNWPMILIAGASDINQQGKNSFQECDQLSLAKPYCKYAARISEAERIPFFVQKAVRISLSGRPGPVYLELPGDVLRTTVNENLIKWPAVFTEPPLSIAPPGKIQAALDLLQSAQSPLVIFGKGAGYSRAQKAINQFIDRTQLPFLPTTLGKGILTDQHPLCVGPARSTALGKADVILLIGARLNWILHYGSPPRFLKNVQFIQIDVQPEELDNNVQGAVNLCGDCTLVMTQFNENLRKNPWSFPINSPWVELLIKQVKENRDVSQKLMNDQALPLQYYSSLKIIRDCLPRNFFYVGEGANTMDIGRTVIEQFEPRTKLDAGSFGTMGIGIPFCIAAQVCRPEKHVVAILGDSAFGFSAMEIETAIRYQIPMTIIILNNNGIFVGVDEISQDPLTTPPVALQPDTHYQKLADAFGGEGIFVRTHQELFSACKQAFSNPDQVFIINVMINPTGMRKPQEHDWLTQDQAQPKL